MWPDLHSAPVAVETPIFYNIVVYYTYKSVCIQKCHKETKEKLNQKIKKQKKNINNNNNNTFRGPKLRFFMVRETGTLR